MAAAAEAVHEALGLKRSDKWPEVERTFRLSHPNCAACDSTAVQVHHVLPFHFAILLGRPDLELDPRNLITLCEAEKGKTANDHHLLLGHLDDFQSYNRNARQYALLYRGRTVAAIRADGGWRVAAGARPGPWASMTDQDKADLRALMDSLYPMST